MMKVTITWTYKISKDLETTFYSDEMDAKEAIYIIEELEKTKHFTSVFFLNARENKWTLKELKKLTQQIETKPHHMTVYFDGGYDVKTKRSGLGCAIYYEQNNQKYRMRKNVLTQGLLSNNEAEYAALHLATKELEMLRAEHIPVTFMGDSMVVINQIRGDWACYEENFIMWMDRIDAQLDRLGIIPTYELIDRNENKEADRLATQALKNIEITSAKALGTIK